MNDTDFKTYTRNQLLEVFEKEPQASFLSWSLPKTFLNAARTEPLAYMDTHYRIAAEPIGGRAAYYAVRSSENACTIYIGFGNSVDPNSDIPDRFYHELGGKDQSGQVAIDVIGTDHDRLEIYIHKPAQQERYKIHLADPFCSKVYPNQTTEDKEQLVSLAGALMRLIDAGEVVDLAAIKAEVDMLDPRKDNPAILLHTYFSSPTVKKLVDDDRERQGKKPLHEAWSAEDFEDVGELRLPKPTHQ